MRASNWQINGKQVELNGHQIFYRDSGGEKPALLILHGYPTSSYDYWKVWDSLSQTFRVIVHDHLGFGFSDKPQGYSYSLIDQTDIAIQLWQHLGITHAHLLGHDYGTSVATELIARRNMGYEPIRLDSLTLCNGSMHIEMAKLRFIQVLLKSNLTGPLVARLSSFRLFQRNIRNIFHDPSQITAEELQDQWAMLIGNGGRAVLPRITQYIEERKRFWHRWIGGLQQSDLRTNIVWATEDPVAVVGMAHVLHEEIANSQLQLLPEAGHFPMLEIPERWKDAVVKLILND